MKAQLFDKREFTYVLFCRFIQARNINLSEILCHAI